MEERIGSRKTREAWAIHVKEVNAGQGAGSKCDQHSSESIPHHAERKMDKKEE